MRVSLFARDRMSDIGNIPERLKEKLSDAGIGVCGIFHSGGQIPDGTDMVLSLGGDGTLLSLLPVMAGSRLPVLGVNYGRMGFLASVSADEAVAVLSRNEYTVEDRALLHTSLPFGCPYALNEFSVHRHGAAMLGVRVSVDGMPLPPYWADGLLVATSSGSTAYSLSVGGPIVFPGSDVFVIAPIAPHNLNVRPLVVPASSSISLEFISRDSQVLVSLDNRSSLVSSDIVLDVSMADFPFRLVRANGNDFIKALKGKLFWGHDIRNSDSGGI